VKTPTRCGGGDDLNHILFPPLLVFSPAVVGVFTRRCWCFHPPLLVFSPAVVGVFTCRCWCFHQQLSATTLHTTPTFPQFPHSIANALN
jgi:hypothetical protein